MDFEDIPFEEILRKEKMITESLERRKTTKSEKKNSNTSDKLHNDFEKNNEIDKRLKKYGRIVSKNSPMEVSSRRQILPEKLENERNYIRNKHNGSKKHNDPRFNDSCGKLNTDLFQKSYTFLDDIRQEEFNQIKNTLDLYKIMNKSKELGTWSKVKKSSKFKNSDINHFTQDQIDNLKLKYQKLISEKDHRKNLFLRQQTISQHRKQEQAKIESGKKPFFLKRKDVNISIQHDKYKDLNKKQISMLEQKINKKHVSKFKPPNSIRKV
ncbi:uncharacterized protein cubi_00827 [Cryptosporidium ubiquitum]|uniref:rRNA biogenesis protein RRP36 n=1 Tax=Cryptosporidium ubiquitum TaxID=857276 RepID=A0A1J4MBP7_9CRYT|nr:uncharacterized protein cubi_00827 [Cryptosporidium ubiquitum]OII70899.1 hypothetical protein cubi_00827 [Cryptosporidium ubiquitum]